MNKRDDSIDIVKGIGIILMVCGHCYAPFTRFIYLFHMAIFFIASGYCFKESNSVNITETGKFIQRKFKNLWFPYVLWTCIFSLSHNLFLELNIYTNNSLLLEYTTGNHLIEYWSITDIIKNICKSFLLHGSTQMGAAFWFIATLMEISILYCIIDSIVKKVCSDKLHEVVQGFISVAFLVIGYTLSLKKVECWGLNRVCSFYILFFGGEIIKKYMRRTEENVIAKAVIAFMVLVVCNRFGSISLDQNQYTNPFFLILVSISGWILLYEIAVLIKKCKVVCRLLIYVGKNSLAIVILHFLCFKIVNYFGVIINKLPRFLIAAFPVLYKNGNWWIAYSIVGVFVPIILSILWKKLYDYVKELIKRCRSD